MGKNVRKQVVNSKKNGYNKKENKRKEGNRMEKKESGITMVALIITVIVMLILAGVALNFTLGDNGLFQKVKMSANVYSEKEAREKLELALDTMIMLRETDNTYNENEYLEQKLKEEAIELKENIATIGQWQFEIDRKNLAIKTKSEEEEEQEIKIETSQANGEGGKVILTVEITSQKEISEVTIGGETVEVPTPENGVYTIQKDITQNGDYTVAVKDVAGRTQSTIARVEGIVGIYTRAESREKLEMTLSEIMMDQFMEPDYNTNEYLDNRLKQQGMKIEGNIVTVNGWQFEIDRNNLTIKD